MAAVVKAMESNRQRSSPTNDPGNQQHQQQQQLLHQQQQMVLQQHPPYPYPVQQQPQGSWTPNITAPPFYPSFYQNHQQPPQQQVYQQQFDPTNANAQLAAQWAYQQMMFNAQQHAAYSLPRPPPQGTQSPTPDYFAQNQIFNPFPSGTPRSDNQQYPGYHPYRRPNRQPSSDRQHHPHPPYARPDASGSTSSLNSSGSHHQRQRTNSNQSAQSSSRGSSSARSSPIPTPPTPASSTPSPLRQPHIRTASASSTASTSTATSIRPSPSLPTTATTTSTSAASSSAAPGPRLARPSPLSQSASSASEKRRSRDDIDLGNMQAELAAQSVNASRSGGLKGRLRRALSFNAAQTLKEEAEAEVEAEAVEKKEKEQRRMDGEVVDDDDDDVSIKASQVNGKLKATTPTIKVKPEEDVASSPQTTTIPPKKKGRAASLFNSRLNASTDNISLSSTVSSASVMIRKLGAMGKLARRNSLAGITSLFKDKDKNKSDQPGEPSSSKEKGKKKDKSAKGNAAQASVSLVTAELDRAGASGDWSVSAGEMNGLSPAAKLARQHTLKSNAEAAEARAREAKEREAAREREREEAEAREAARAVLANGVTQVPTWDRNTATRSPNKGGGMRINEDGTRTFVEDEDEDESEDGLYQRFQPQLLQGWGDDEDWDLDGDGDEDATIRVGVQPRSSSETGRSSGSGTDEEHEPWAVDVRRSVERTRQPARGILKRAESYDQQAYLHEHSAPTQRMRSNSYNSPSQSELGPLARIPSPDPDHIDGLHRHGSHSSAHGQSASIPTPVLPPLSFDSGSPLSTTFDPSITSKDLPATPSSTSTSISTFSSSTSFTTVSASTPITTHTEHRTSQIFQHPNFNSSAPALASSSFGSKPPTLTHRSATSPSKRLTFATNLSVYDTFSASVYDRRSEPATWSRLTPALAQRIKEELNSYKMEEMEVHAASRIHTQFFV